MLSNPFVSHRISLAREFRTLNGTKRRHLRSLLRRYDVTYHEGASAAAIVTGRASAYPKLPAWIVTQTQFVANSLQNP